MTRSETDFPRFVGVSVVAHGGILLAIFAFLLLGRRQETPVVVSFELVGVPGKAVGSAGAAKREGAKQAAKEVAQESVKSEPTQPPSKSEDIPLKKTPEKTATTAVGKSALQAKPTGKIGDEGASKVSGKGGTGNDTLVVGTGAGGGGAPSYMTAWLTRVRILVERQWRVPEGSSTPKGAPVVAFAVARDGRPGRPALVSASGNPLVDRLALRAIQAVETFPPPPDAWPKEEVKLRYVLEIRSP
jgi:TonB family protein